MLDRPQLLGEKTGKPLTFHDGDLFILALIGVLKTAKEVNPLPKMQIDSES